ncbi:unnamed protein product [Spirodela intermedia]|uniref:Uncharacterized protein n=2 Tax=Spirodela intermedia TaxID=51605 RepID=A0A7I8IEV2_SPIIN|nr:unnamed protein product [Spirodela intermedia]CAA6655924.1 unnamed protein product [Spirodela intermedia]CAA7391321.1 unnamed protein product [Spirodela intermedia]
MGIHLLGISHPKHATQRAPGRRSSQQRADVPKGHFAIYVGNEEKRFVVPISYLKHPLFQNLLQMAEEEFGLDQPMGGLRLPCSELTFSCVVSQMRRSSSRSSG